MQPPIIPSSEQVVTGITVHLQKLHMGGVLLPRLTRRLLISGSGQLAVQLFVVLNFKRTAACRLWVLLIANIVAYHGRLLGRSKGDIACANVA